MLTSRTRYFINRVKLFFFQSRFRSPAAVAAHTSYHTAIQRILRFSSSSPYLLFSFPQMGAHKTIVQPWSKGIWWYFSTSLRSIKILCNGVWEKETSFSILIQSSSFIFLAWFSFTGVGSFEIKSSNANHLWHIFEPSSIFYWKKKACQGHFTRVSSLR